MHTGANLLLNVVDVFTWIRHHRHVFATDIVEMYRQVQVDPDDWDLQQILWVDDQLNEVSCQLTTVTYGTRAAPFLATRALLQLVKDEGHRFPLAVPSLTHGRYIDDIFGGTDSIEDLIAKAHQITGLCNAGGFPLSKWHSNHPDLLNAVSTECRIGSVSLDDCPTKLLGLSWLPQGDKFIFLSKFTEDHHRLTKHLILSEVAQIFDPLGFVAPVVIKAKILLQELWLHKLGWDDPLPSLVATRWLLARDDLKRLTSI